MSARCVTGKFSSTWKRSNAASIGTISPSWTLCAQVSIVRYRDVNNLQAEEERSRGGSFNQEIRCGVQPQPSHQRAKPVSRASAIEVNDISSIFEAQPLVPGEDITPGAAPTHSRLKTAHLLHGPDLGVAELNVRILLQQPLSYVAKVCCTVLSKHACAVIMTIFQVFDVSKACITRSKRVCTKIVGLWNDVQGGRFLPIEAEETSCKIAGGVNDTRRVSCPEIGLAP